VFIFVSVNVYFVIDSVLVLKHTANFYLLLYLPATP